MRVYMQFKFFPLSIFTLISLSCTGCFAEENKDTNPYRAQDISLKTLLYKNDGLSFYLEVDAGYRHDHINNDLEFYDPLCDVEGGREQKMDFTQLNFRAGALIAKYLFIKGMIGYAFLNHDKDYEASYFVGSDY